MIIPQYISLEDWAASLLIDFPDENVPILYNKEEWKDWGNDVIDSPLFSQLNVPRTELYDNWQDWANVFYLSAGMIQG